MAKGLGTDLLKLPEIAPTKEGMLVNPRAILGLTFVAVLAGCGAGRSSSSLPAGGLQPIGVAKVHATEKVLYSFADGVDGGGPNGGLVFDASGNAYGTTHFGGNDSCGGQVGGGCGVVFELSPNASGGWSETPLYAFQDSSDGGFPNAGVILDKSGNVLGTASTGGSFACSIGCGVVYELSKGSAWAETVLHTFDGSDGEFPNAALLPSANGTLYGTTWYGGSGNGTVFSLAPGSGGWKESVLYGFQGTADGSAPATSTARRTSSTAITTASHSSCASTLRGRIACCTASPITAAGRIHMRE